MRVTYRMSMSIQFESKQEASLASDLAEKLILDNLAKQFKVTSATIDINEITMPEPTILKKVI